MTEAALKNTIESGRANPLLDRFSNSFRSNVHPDQGMRIEQELRHGERSSRIVPGFQFVVRQGLEEGLRQFEFALQQSENDLWLHLVIIRRRDLRDRLVAALNAHFLTSLDGGKKFGQIGLGLVNLDGDHDWLRCANVSKFSGLSNLAVLIARGG
jgi:hypothetical protein